MFGIIFNLICFAPVYPLAGFIERSLLVWVHNVGQLVTVIFVTQFVYLYRIVIEKVNKLSQMLDAAGFLVFRGEWVARA